MESLTKHHLIPRTRHRKKRNKRLFSRQDVKTRILWVCRPCHNHIHDILTEKELETSYNTREALLRHPDIRRFVEWIGSKPAQFKPGSRTMRTMRHAYTNTTKILRQVASRSPCSCGDREDFSG